MDIVKARQKAKQRKREGHGASPESASQWPAPSSERTLPPEPVPPRERPYAEAAPVVERRGPRDPLTDFLAAYDDGELPADEAISDEAPAVEDEQRYLWFDLAGEAYAASIMDVREILRPVVVTEVPRIPSEMLGVIAKRGVVMPVIDVAAIIGLRAAAREMDRENRVLVVGDGDRVCGLRVDRVRQVVRLGQRAIEEVPPSLGTKNVHMLLGLGRVRLEATGAAQMLILLDVPAVLQHLAETMGIATAIAEEGR